MLDNTFLQFRKFDVPVNYKTIIITWPVELYECAATQYIGKLNCLEKAVLRFIDIGITEEKMIGKTLHISPELVAHIKNEKQEYFLDERGKHLSNEGKEALEDDNKSLIFSNKKKFGYMMVNPFDGEVLPFFIQGELPFFVKIPDEALKILLPKEYSSKQFINKGRLKAEHDLTEAYKKSCNIGTLEETIKQDEQDSFQVELAMNRSLDSEVLYDQVDDAGNLKADDAEKTMAEKMKEEEIGEAQVIILDDKSKYVNLYIELLYDQYHPDDIQFVSPFNKNKTVWYNKKLAYFREKANHIECQSPGSDKQFFEDAIFKEIRKGMFIVPSIPVQDFENFIKIHYPELNKALKFKNNISKGLKEYYDYLQDWNKERSRYLGLVSSGARLLEVLFNIFIAKIQDRNTIIYTPFFETKYRSSEIVRENVHKIFSQYGLKNCRALRAGVGYVYEMKGKRGWNVGRRIGNSSEARFFFLVLEAFLIGKNPFKKIIEKDAPRFANFLDYVTEIRNTKVSHNDKEKFEHTEPEEIDKFCTAMDYLTKKMINVLAEEEK